MCINIHCIHIMNTHIHIYICGTWWRVVRVDAVRQECRGFESRSSRHVGTFGQVLRLQLPVAQWSETPTQHPCCVYIYIYIYIYTYIHSRAHILMYMHAHVYTSTRAYIDVTCTSTCWMCTNAQIPCIILLDCRKVVFAYIVCRSQNMFKVLVCFA